MKPFRKFEYMKIRRFGDWENTRGEIYEARKHERTKKKDCYRE